MKIPCQAALVAILAIGITAGAAPAEEPVQTAEKVGPDDPRGTFSIQIENDLFGSGEDRNYTNGLRASWLSPEGSVPGWLRDAAGYVPWHDGSGRLRYGFSFGQNMYAPDDLTRSDLIVNERPYAGWLYGGVGVTSDTGQRLDTLELDIGIIGPYSLAEDTQKFWHNVVGSTDPKGWDNQVRTEPGIVLFYERKWRAICGLHVIRVLGLNAPDEACQYEVAGLAVDATPHLGVALGNVHTHAAAGVTFRFGRDLPSDYGPPRIRPSLPGSDFFEPNAGFGWYIFAGVEGRAVARNIFLDGNSFRDSHSVDKENFVADVQAGVAVIVGRARVSYTYIYRTSEYRLQDRADQFGSVNVSLRF